MDSPTTPPEDVEVAEPPARPAAAKLLRATRVAAAVLWTVAILALCWMPGRWVQETGEASPWFEIPNLDKVVHWGIFVVFTVLWLRTGTSKWRSARVAVGGLALAVVTEVVQHAVPAIQRDGEVGDAITDLIGVAIGLALARRVEPLFRRAEALFFGASEV